MISLKADDQKAICFLFKGSGSGSGYVYGSGSGSGSSDGSGSGDGYGSGYGDGYGSGSGSGSGSGDGYGDGSGYGIKSVNRNDIFLIDGVETIILSIKQNIAKGFILQSDLTLKPCYIAKVGNSFAHGETIRVALKDAKNKELENSPLEDRIAMFFEEFLTTEKYPAMNFFEWHSILTGSCELGRKQFVKENEIDLDSDEFTVLEFIEKTKHAYFGSEEIKELEVEFKNRS